MNALKAISRLAIAVAALAALAGPAQAASRDETAIRAQTTTWVKAYNGGDAKTIASLYAEDAILLPPGAPAVKGRAAILEFATKAVAGSKDAGAVFAVDPKTDVGISGGMGWESGTYKVTIKGAVVETGKFLSVSGKKGGKWLYIRDTWNADGAPVLAPAAPATPAPPKK